MSERLVEDGVGALSRRARSLDASEMKLLKKVGASARSMKLRTVVAPGKCAEGFFCSPYRSLVLGAFNAYGQSVYAIVATQDERGVLLRRPVPGLPARFTRGGAAGPTGAPKGIRTPDLHLERVAS